MQFPMCFSTPIAFGPSKWCSRYSAGLISAPLVVPNRVPAAALALFPRLRLFQIVFPRPHWRVRSVLPSSAALQLQRWAAAAQASFPCFGLSKSCSRCSASLIPVFGPGIAPALQSFQIALPLQRCSSFPSVLASFPHFGSSDSCCVPLCDVMLCVAMLCDAMLHHAMPRHAMTCYVSAVLFYAMLRRALPSIANPLGIIALLEMRLCE